MQKCELLQNVLAKYDNSAITAYMKKDRLLEFRAIPRFDISLERFRELLNSYGDREIIMREYSIAQEKKDNVGEELKEMGVKQKQYERMLNPVKVKELPEEVQFAIQEMVNSSSKTIVVDKESLVSASLLHTSDITFIEGILTKIQTAENNIYDLPGLQNQVHNAQIELKNGKQHYQQMHLAIFQKHSFLRIIYKNLKIITRNIYKQR